MSNARLRDDQNEWLSRLHWLTGLLFLTTFVRVLQDDCGVRAALPESVEGIMSVFLVARVFE